MVSRPSEPSPERLHQSLSGISNLIPRPQSNCFSCARKSSPVHLGLACAQAARPPCASCEPRWSATKRPLRQAFSSGPHQRHRTSSPKHLDCCMCALSLASGVFTFLHLCVSLSFLALGVQVTVTSRPRPTRDVSRFCDTSNMQRQVSRPPAPQLSPQEGGVKVRDGDRAVRERFIQKRGETYLVLPRKRC